MERQTEFLERLQSLDYLVSIQTSPGNCDVDEYMRGLANGLLLAQHVLYGKDGVPNYIEAKKKVDVVIKID